MLTDHCDVKRLKTDLFKIYNVVDWSDLNSKFIFTYTEITEVLGSEVCVLVKKTSLYKAV